MKFKTRNTKVLLLSHGIAIFFIIFLMAEIIELWEENNQRSLELILLVGMVFEFLGFVIMLNPKFISMITQQEFDFFNEAVLYILAGLLIQVITIYYFF